MTAIGLETCSRCKGEECPRCMWRGVRNPSPAEDAYFAAIAEVIGSRLTAELFAQVIDPHPELVMAFEAERRTLSRTGWVKIPGPEEGSSEIARIEERPDGRQLWEVHA